MTTPTMPDMLASDQIAELRRRLAETEDILRAIRSGEVDAITVNSADGVQVYSLNSAEQPYREMIEAMSEGAVNITADGVVLYCNQCFAHLIKADLHTIMGSSLLAYFVERDRAGIIAALAESREGTSRVRAHLLATDGGLVPVNVAMHVVADVGIRSIILVTSDLTQMVVAQEAANKINLRLEQANRSLRMLNMCNTTIIHATNEVQMLTDTCHALVNSGGYKLAWVGYAEHDEERSVRPVALAGGAADYVETAHVSWGDSERGRGPAGTAIRSGRMTIVHDTDTDATFGPWRDTARREGFHSLATMPLRDGDDVFGALMAYSGRPDAFDEQEAGILTELADDMAYCITNLRRAATLAATQALLNNILQSSIKYSIVGATLDRTILFWNEGARRIYGYDAEEAVGQRLDVLYAPECRNSDVKTMLETALDTGLSEAEFERIHKDGTRFLAQTVVTRRDDISGNPVGYLLISSDISKQRKAEVDLQESSSVFRTLTSAMPQMVWMCKPGRMNIYLNQQWVDYTGLTLEESYGRGWGTAFHPDDQQVAWDTWNHATETGELYRVESRLRAADGSYRWFLIRGAPVVDADGKMSKWCGTCTDIDDLKRAEEQLRAVSQYARSLLEACLDPLITVNPDGLITDVNHATELITGQIRQRLIGSDFAIYFTETERARTSYQRVFSKGFLIDTRLAIRHVAGTVTEVLCNASLYRDGSGRVAGVFLVARDISRMLPADLIPSPKRRSVLWRNAGVIAVAAALIAMATIAPTISHTWLQLQRNQYDIAELTATNKRMRTLLNEVAPRPARVQAARVQQSGSTLGPDYIIAYAVAAPNHDAGLIGDERPLPNIAGEVYELSTGNCVHPPTPQDGEAIICPIAGKTGLLGLLFMTWDRGDPMPADLVAAAAVLKRAGSDIATIWLE